MDAWGIDGCEQNRDWIIEKLKSNAEKYSWLETIKIAAQNLINPFAVSLAMSGDFYSAIVDAAIQRAKERGVT